ncbi:MAG: flagellar basal body-associated FliL family protein [Ignavibacteria bacterium]|nr:flagellar basal body-associated FliL family protein [Ignavibacteria bacterium]
MAKKEENDLNTEGKQPEVSKDTKTSGTIGLIPILGIVFGSLILLIIATRFIFLPYIVENLSGGGKKAEEKAKEEVKLDKKLMKYFETGRITTNPLNSDQFVVVNLAMKFSARDEKVLKEIFGEGGEAGAVLQPEIMAPIRSKINQILGSLTVAELQQRRNNLANEFKDSLKPIFSSHQLILNEVYLQEFIIQ